MTRTYKPSQIADGILAEEFFRDTEFVLASEVERLRAFEAVHRQLQAALDTAIRERDEARAEVDRLRAEKDKLRDEKEALHVAVARIERASAGAIYSQESIYAMASSALEALEAKP